MGLNQGGRKCLLLLLISSSLRLSGEGREKEKTNEFKALPPKIRVLLMMTPKPVQSSPPVPRHAALLLQAVLQCEAEDPNLHGREYLHAYSRGLRSDRVRRVRPRLVMAILGRNKILILERGLTYVRDVGCMCVGGFFFPLLSVRSSSLGKGGRVWNI